MYDAYIARAYGTIWTIDIIVEMSVIELSVGLLSVDSGDSGPTMVQAADVSCHAIY